MLEKLFKNYSAWNVDEKQFSTLSTMGGRLKFLLRYAILAPSSHNTQPWKFYVGDDYIDVYADLSRKLTYSDPSGRMLYTAIGCAVSNMKIAATYFGLHAAIVYNPKLTDSLPKHIATLRFTEDTPNRTFQTLLAAITSRASYRGKYSKERIPENLLDALRNRNSQEPSLHLDFFSKNTEKESLASIASEGMRSKMSLKEFRGELADWVRNNLTRKNDGMPGSGHGMKLAISILAPFILRHVDVSKKEQEKTIKRVQNFPAIGVISSDTDNALSWIKSGELLQELLLSLQAEDMGASIMAAPVEDTPSREKLQTYTSAAFPQIFFGFGYRTKSFPHSPRRPLEEVLIDQAI